MFKKMLLLTTTVAVAALAASAALASPPQPPSPHNPQTAAAPSKAHHGMTIRLKLNSTVSDGQNAQFSLTIAKHAGQSAQYVIAGIGWSFDGREPESFQYASLDNLTSSQGAVQYVDQAKHWMRVGSLNVGNVYHVDGQVAVPDRGQMKATSAQFFCVTAYVYSSVPGHANARWGEQSNMACSQYSVS